MATNVALDGRFELTDDAAPTQVLDASDGSSVVLPDGLSPTTAEFVQSGPDLVMEWPDGSEVVVRDYFAGDNPPEIASANGATLGGDLVSQLAGPIAPGQVAQAGTGTAEQPIGQVEQVSGTVVAVRADGTRVELQEGSPVYQGDVLESSADGSIGVILADETSFSMAENGQMVLDEMVYDPATQEGSISMSVVEGVFTFVSGNVAKTDPDAMTLNTPVATIGIRGTQVGIDLTNPEDVQFVLMEEGDGFVGEVVIKNDAGVVVLNKPNASTNLEGYDREPAEVRQIEPREIAEAFSGALKAMPTNDNNANNYGVQEDGSVDVEELEEKTTSLDELAAEEMVEEEVAEEVAEELADFDTAAGEAEPEVAPAAVTVEASPVVEPEVLEIFEAPVVEEEEPAPEPEDEAPEEVVEAYVPQVEGVNLTVSSTTGAEDNSIALNISVSSNDVDGTETTTIMVSGVPAGATLSAGTDNGDGTWTLTTGDLGGLSVTPPLDFNGDMNLTVTATSTETTGVSQSVSAGLNVSVTPVGDYATITATNVAGDEDSTINLDITTSMDPATGETVDTVTISGVPIGSVLSAGTDNGDGSWTLTTDQLADLTLTPPTDYSGTLSLGVSVVTTDGSVSEATVGVEVIPVTDIETVITGGGAGEEDGAIALNLTVTSDPSISEETVTISGVPAGATLSAGTDNLDGTWTLSSADIEAGALDTLTITPPEDYSGSVDLGVSIAMSDGSTAVANVSVDVAAVADAPDVSVLIGDPTIVQYDDDRGGGNDDDDDGVGDGTYDVDNPNYEGPAPLPEGSYYPVDISASLTDVDGSETLSDITVAGIPVGATLSAGTDNGDGTWTLTSTDLEGLTLFVPPEVGTEFSISVSATSSELTGDAATTTVDADVSFDTMASTPTLSVTNVSGDEDSAIILDVSAALTDTDGSEQLSITISGMPDGASLTAGTDNGDGTWTLDSGDLEGLMLFPPVDYNGDLNLSITATSTELHGGDTAVASADFTVSVAPVADAATVTGSGAGAEDTAIALDITATMDEGTTEAVDSITISGVPTGATLSAGTDNLDGTWTLTPDQLAGLEVTPPQHFSGSIDLGVSVTTTDGTTTTTTATVDVSGVADAPTVSLSIGEPVVVNSGDKDRGHGNEKDGGLDPDNPNYEGPVTGGTGDGTTYPVDITASLVDTDGSETLSVTVSGVPVGATLSAGTDNGDGTWTLSSDQLSGLTLHVPPGASDGFTLTATATATEANGDTASSTADATVGIDSTASAPTLSVVDTAGDEDGAIALDIAAGLTDTDGSETLGVTIAGVPTGATLSAGTDNGDGTWTLDADQLTGLNLNPAADFNGDINLTVTATSTEFNGGATASTSGTVTVSVAPVADAATVTGSGAGAEDTAIALDITATMDEGTTEAVDSITISGVPTGATLSAGTDNLDGTWTLTPDQLAGLNLNPPADFNGDINLTVSATTTDGTVTDASMTVSVTPVDDAATVTINPAPAVEDAPFALNIEASDIDNTITEVTITGMPEGSTLSNGTDLFTVGESGSVTVTPSQLSGLELQTPLNFNGDISLGVTANGVSASADVTVAPVDDAATVTINPAPAVEDAPFALNVEASDIDNTITEVTITGMPEGSTLSNGTDTLVIGASGSVTLTPSQLSGLELQTPLNFNGDISLGVTANGVSASADVTVAPVDDAATVTINPAPAVEDAPFALNIEASDIDNTITEVTITGMPEGSTLSNGTDLFTVGEGGSVTLAPSQLSGLELQTPLNFNGDISLGVTANGVSASADVTVAPADDTATVTINPAPAVEDAPFALNVEASDIDNTITEVTITGMPEGSTLSNGTDTLVIGASGSVTLSPAQLSGLELQTPLNFNGDVTLTATATLDDGSTASSGATTVSVAPVNDAPTLTATGGSVDENLPAGTVVGTIAVADVDADDTLTVTLNDPSGLFEIVDGEIRTTTELDYETATSHTLSVTVTDQAGESATQDVTINVNDVVEGGEPNQIILDGTYSGRYVSEHGTDDADEMILSGKFNNITGKLNVEAEQGDDTMTLSGDFNNIKKMDVEGEAGDDTITLSGDFNNITDEIDVEGGGGSDDITLSGQFTNVDEIEISGGGKSDGFWDDGDGSYSWFSGEADEGDNITLSGSFTNVDEIEIKGGAGDDTIDLSQGTFQNVDEIKVEGGAGDDVIIGGSGSETFVFDKESGDDIIKNLMEQDTIEFEGHSFDAKDMIFSEDQESGDVVISFSGNDDMSVTLEGVKFDTLAGEDGKISEGDGYTVSSDHDGLSVTVDLDPNN